MTAPALFLAGLARRYRLERTAARVVSGCAAGVALAGLLHYAGAGNRGILLGLATGLALGLLLAWAGEHQGPVTSHTVAQHLNRVLPELEESATLLVNPPAVTAALARLQQQRVVRRFDPARARAALPRTELSRAAVVGGALLAIGLTSFLLPPAARGMRWINTAGADGTSLTLRTLEVEVTPPSYTGLPSRVAEAGDLEVEEGARLRWEVATAGPVDHGWLIPSAGDSVPLVANSEGRWEASTRAERSMLIRVRLVHGDSLVLTSDDYRLAVRPDRAPLLTVVKP